MAQWIDSTTIVTSLQQERVLSRLNGSVRVEAFEAAKEIWKDPDLSLERPLLQTLRCGARPFNRMAAAHAMQVLSTQRTIRALERAVGDGTENPGVRGEAAEALAHSHRQESHLVLLKALLDPSREVRFWCAFALG